MYDENGYGVNECLPTMQQVAGTQLPALSKWSQSRISYECPALELLTFNAIIFDVAAPVSAALLFLSLFFVERKQETPTVTIVGDRSNATSGCVVFSLLHANTNCLQDSKNTGDLSCMQKTFVLFFGVWTCNILFY